MLVGCHSLVSDFVFQERRRPSLNNQQILGFIFASEFARSNLLMLLLDFNIFDGQLSRCGREG